MELEAKKQIICDFLDRCNAYSDAKLAQYQQQVDDTDTHQVLELLEKMGQWRTYKSFNQYAISELKTDRLDDWFE